MEWTVFSDDIEEVFTKKELEKAPLMEPEQFKPPATWNETQLQGDQEQLVMGSMQRIADKVTLIYSLLPTAREGNVITGVYLSTIGLVATLSLLDLVTARSVGILLECCLVLVTY